MSFGGASAKPSTLKKDDKATRKEPEPPKPTKTQSTTGKAAKKEATPEARTAKAPTPTPAAGPSQRKASARSKRTIMSDDEDEGAEMVKTDTAEPDETPQRAQTSSMVRADDQAAMEAMMGMDDFDMDAEDEAQGSTSTAAPSAVKESKGRSSGGPRKKRKVQKKVQEQNAKGYMGKCTLIVERELCSCPVTKTIWVEESCSEGEEDEPAPKAGAKRGSKSAVAESATTSRASSVTDTEDRKPSISAKGSSSSVAGSNKGKPLPKPAPKPAAGKPKGQSTLAGFFTKK